MAYGGSDALSPASNASTMNISSLEKEASTLISSAEPTTSNADTEKNVTASGYNGMLSGCVRRPTPTLTSTSGIQLHRIERSSSEEQGIAVADLGEGSAQEETYIGLTGRVHPNKQTYVFLLRY
jgi:hypothetical protein